MSDVTNGSGPGLRIAGRLDFDRVRPQQLGHFNLPLVRIDKQRPNVTVTEFAIANPSTYPSTFIPPPASVAHPPDRPARGARRARSGYRSTGRAADGG